MKLSKHVNSFRYSKTAVLVSSLVLLSNPSFSQEQANQDSLWDIMKFYENEEGDYLKGTGRLQLDAIWLDSNQSGEYSDVYWRRARFGFEGKYKGVTGVLEADIDLNGSLDDSFKRITNANLSWYLDSGAKVKVLKQKVPFMLGGKTSSKKLLTTERSNLTNNLWFVNSYFNGISIEDTLDNNWHYFAGVYSSDESTGISLKEGSFFGLYSIGHTFSANQYWDNAVFSLDTVINDTSPDANTEDFSQVSSFSAKFHRGQWGLWTDIAYGNGQLGQSDLWGYEIMPFYSQSDKLQWVARYTYMNSQDENGIRLGRNDSRIESGRGDQYREIYAGLNWYLNNHKLKLQFGLQYANMDDQADDGGEFNGWGFTTGFRLYW